MSMGSVIRRAVEGFAAKSGKGAAKETAEKTAKETVEKTVKGTAEKTAKETAGKTAKGTAEQTAKETAEKTAKGTTERTARDAAEETAGSTGRAAGKADDGLDPDMFDGSFADDAIDPVTTPEAPKGAAGGDKPAAPAEAPQPGKDAPKAGGTAAGKATAEKTAEAAGDAATAKAEAKAEAKAARRAAMAERAGQAARYAARHPKGVGMTALGVGLATPGISNLVSGGLSNLAGNAVGTIDDSVRKGVSQVRGPSQTDQQQQQTGGAQGGGLLSKAADGISSEIGTPAGLTAAGGLAASMLSSKGSLVHTAGTAAAVLGTLAAGSQYLSGRSHAGLSTPAVDRGRQDAGRKASGTQQGRAGTPGQDYELTPDSEPLPDEPGL